MAHNNAQRYVSAFVSQAMRSALEESAREHERSLSGEIRMALRAYLAEPRHRDHDHVDGGDRA